MNLTGKEVARRIREHNKIHQYKEPMNSPIITEILEVAAVLFEKVDAGDYQVVKHGQWELVRYDPDYLVWSAKCTNCKKRHESTDNVGKLPFCPHCGAQMNGERIPRLFEVD